MDFYKNFLDQSEIEYLNSNTYHDIFLIIYGSFSKQGSCEIQSTLLREKIGCGQKIPSVDLTNKKFGISL